MNKFLLDTYTNKEIYEVYFTKDQIKHYSKKCEEYICFGIDEYFLNHILYEYLIKSKKPIIIHLPINLIDTLYFYYINKKKKSSKFHNYIDILIKDVMPNFKNSSNKEKEYYLFYNTFYDNNDVPITQDGMNESHKKLILNFYKLITKVYKDRDFEIFDKDILDIYLQKENISYMRKDSFIFYNSDTPTITIPLLKIDMTKTLINKYYNIVDKNRKNLLL
jgi:hypothetical protein